MSGGSSDSSSSEAEDNLYMEFTSSSSDNEILSNPVSKPKFENSKPVSKKPMIVEIGSNDFGTAEVFEQKMPQKQFR